MQARPETRSRSRAQSPPEQARRTQKRPQVSANTAVWMLLKASYKRRTTRSATAATLQVGKCCPCLCITLFLLLPPLQHVHTVDGCCFCCLEVSLQPSFHSAAPPCSMPHQANDVQRHTQRRLVNLHTHQQEPQTCALATSRSTARDTSEPRMPQPFRSTSESTGQQAPNQQCMLHSQTTTPKQHGCSFARKGPVHYRCWRA
jgi:hypothetical protein